MSKDKRALYRAKDCSIYLFEKVAPRHTEECQFPVVGMRVVDGPFYKD
jgi:hypothetical protein